MSERLETLIENLTNRVKTAEKNTAEVSKENKKLKTDLHGLRDAHNNRVKEFIGNKGAIDAISQHMQQQFSIVQGMRYAMSAMMKKGLISTEEITEFTNDLLDQAEKGNKDGKAEDKPTEPNETEKQSESGSVQPEGDGASEGSGGTSNS